jgi:H+/Cl- antiporter ClcA
VKNSPKPKQDSFLKVLIAAGATVLVTALGAWIFLAGLTEFTNLRLEDPRYFLLGPVVGLITGLVFAFISQRSTGGNTLLVSLLRKTSDESIKESVPGAMAPIIIFTTWISHLAGLSVGREGTAVQMGGGLAASFSRLFQVHSRTAQRLLLQIGIASGFAAVFGVPTAGAVFALEVAGDLRLATIRKNTTPMAFFIAILFCAFLADWIAREAGAKHMHYPNLFWSQLLDFKILYALILAALVFGLLAWIFLSLLDAFRVIWSRMVRKPWLRPVIGGLFFMPMAYAPGWLQRYAGLGTDVIGASFLTFPEKFQGLQDAMLKIAFTVYAIGTGFRGGEVTPLFFVGATSGNYIASLFGIDPTVIAAVGLVAIFAAAADIPIACSVMAGELFGLPGFVVTLPVCLVAAKLCRRSRLYDH